MRVACVLDTYPRDSEIFIRREIAELRKQNVDITVFSICRPDPPDPDTVYLKRSWDTVLIMRTARILCTTLERSPAVLAARLLKAPVFADLTRHIASGKFNVTHAHFLGIPSTAGLVASVLTGTPLTISAHARDIFAKGEAVREKAAHALAVFTCFQGGSDKLVEMGISESKVHLARHGIPIQQAGDSTERPPTDVPVIIAAGRFIEKKGFEYLIDALAILTLGGLPFKCILCGDGPMRVRLKEKARLSGLGGRIVFCGWKSHEEMTALFRQGHIFVHSGVVASDGDRDGVPNVVLEAMASGLAVAATDAGGVLDAVIDGQTGLIAPAGDSRALANIIRRLISNIGLRASLSAGARKLLAERFDLSSNVRILIDTWQTGQGTSFLF